MPRSKTSSSTAHPPNDEAVDWAEANTSAGRQYSARSARSQTLPVIWMAPHSQPSTERPTTARWNPPPLRARRQIETDGRENDVERLLGARLVRRELPPLRISLFRNVGPTAREAPCGARPSGSGPKRNLPCETEELSASRAHVVQAKNNPSRRLIFYGETPWGSGPPGFCVHYAFTSTNRLRSRPCGFAGGRAATVPGREWGSSAWRLLCRRSSRGAVW